MSDLDKVIQQLNEQHAALKEQQKLIDEENKNLVRQKAQRQRKHERDTTIDGRAEQLIRRAVILLSELPVPLEQRSGSLANIKTSMEINGLTVVAIAGLLREIEKK